MDYKQAGVDVNAGYKSVELIREIAGSTFRKEVLSELGGFGAMFSLAKAREMEDPVLVSGTDGVGTKLKIAFLMDRHDTIGIDCVAMCVNDIVCSGAEPLFFLDYIACEKNYPEKISEIVKGIGEGCRQAGAALIGGETAEMPGFYQKHEYDIAGFTVGLVDRAGIIDGSTVVAGDALIGLSSNGLHSNGFSLVRKVLRPNEKNIKEEVVSLGCSLGEELIRPTKIYVKTILEIKNKIEIKGISHITGGGLIENIPRILPKGLKAVIYKDSWPASKIFELIMKSGKVKEKDMYNTFNMGIGMVLIVDKSLVEQALSELLLLGETAFVIGEVEEGEEICFV